MLFLERTQDLHIRNVIASKVLQPKVSNLLFQCFPCIKDAYTSVYISTGTEKYLLKKFYPKISPLLLFSNSEENSFAL